MAKRIVLERYEGGSSTADILPNGAVRVSARLEGKQINGYLIEQEEMAKLVPAWLAEEEARKQRIQADADAAAQRQRIIDEARGTF